MKSPSLLLDESPLLILPSLACLIGDRHAIVLQQIHFWIVHYRRKRDQHHLHNGHWWMYNSLSQWQIQFPWWSSSTIRRILERLRADHLLITANYNYRGYDRTLWYRINYKHLDNLLAEQAAQAQLELEQVNPPAKAYAHFEQIDMLKLSKSTSSNRTNASAQNEQIDVPSMSGPIPETTRDKATDNQIWALCLQELQMQMTRSTFTTWLKDTTLVIQDDHATIMCRNTYAVDWLQHRLNAPIQRALSGIIGRAITVAYATDIEPQKRSTHANTTAS